MTGTRQRPYTLTLTVGDRKAFEFVGDRYGNGIDMINILINGLSNGEEWDDPRTLTFYLMEHEAWQIQSLAEEDDYLFPLFSGNLKEKMWNFIDQIV